MAQALQLCTAMALALALPPAAVAQVVAGDCHQYTNKSCEECLKNVTCLWCASSGRCMEYPVRRVLPSADLCELRSARWGVCWGAEKDNCLPGARAQGHCFTTTSQRVLHCVWVSRSPMPCGDVVVGCVKQHCWPQADRSKWIFSHFVSCPRTPDTLNFEALIIAMSVVGGTILIMFGLCCCCCCKKKSKKPDKDEERAAREREKRRVRQEERRAEMKSRHDEIRRKYGLFKEENPYAKFEN